MDEYELDALIEQLRQTREQAAKLAGQQAELTKQLAITKEDSDRLRRAFLERDTQSS